MAGQALGGHIAGSVESPLLKTGTGFVGQLGRFSEAGGGYDQARQAIITTLEKTLRINKGNKGLSDPADFAKNTLRKYIKEILVTK